ncbi:restriction endonuclease subunit S [uncultured Bacteroides sp.]|uniref:restriction endonuclease subunit S n=1 Tax=uncultured Bacteroides sp. TaxID=162156 RepID=UPI002AAB72DF|nr:restriction endonuclease subunit S [uncultured Bacteroides sp.]
MKKYSSYIDSGVQWLGEIPEHWKLKSGYTILYEVKEKNKGMKRNTVLSLSYGKIKIKEVEDLNGLVPESFETYQLVNKGDLIFRPTDLQNDHVSLRSAMSDYEGIITSAYLNFRLLPNTDSRYYSYIFRNIDNNKVIYGLGSGLRQNISFLDFKRFIFPYPPLPEQTRIAQFLDKKTALIDKAIALKEKQIELLKERRQILIHRAVTRGLNPNVKLKDSGVEWIGEIPEHWEVKKLKHVTSKIGSGVTPSGGGSTYLDSGIPLLRSQNILFDRIDLEGVAYISEKTHASMSNSHVKKGDVLLNITGGSIGRCYFIDINFPLNVNQHVCIVRPNNKISTIYLNGILASEVGQAQIYFFQQGGGREGLNFQALKNFFIPLPTISEQETISKCIKHVSYKISTAITLKEKEIEKLKEYKSVLINEAVSGKIKIN